MRIGENLLNEVPVGKSILVDFDQFTTLVTTWKAKWVHEGYSWFKKTPKRPLCRQYSLHLIYFFCWEDNCKDPWGSVQLGFQLINGTITGRSTWRSFTIFGCSKSFLDLKVLNARTVKAERGAGRISEREERKGGNDYFNLVFTYVIFSMRDVTVSPKYNFEKLLRKLTISDFCWVKTQGLM